MKNPVEIWLPWLGELDPSRRTYETRLRPDVPGGVDYTSDELDIDAVTGRPFTQYAYIFVDAADVDKCTARIAEKDVPERDKRFRDMLRHCRGDMTKAQAFFAALPADMKAKKDAIADVLAQAEARGMKKADADKVRSDKGISAAKQI